LKRLIEHDWPGNVRELKNTIESAAVMSSGETLTLESLPELVTMPSYGDELRIALGTSLADIERMVINRYVERYATKARAAQALGIGLRTLYTKLSSYALKLPKRHSGRPK
jgi:DNA-binding NtrC family response regulator